MSISRFVSLISFLIPINFYIIASNYGWGLQFPLLRIQDTTAFGLNTVFIWQEMGLVLDGHITGRTALSILLWVGGTFLLGVSAILYISRRGSRKGTAGAYGLGCVLFVTSTMTQYGPFFDGPAGIAIPIGLPLLVLIGYFLWRDSNRSDVADEDNANLDEPDDAPFATSPAALAGADASADD